MGGTDVFEYPSDEPERVRTISATFASSSWLLADAVNLVRDANGTLAAGWSSPAATTTTGEVDAVQSLGDEAVAALTDAVAPLDSYANALDEARAQIDLLRTAYDTTKADHEAALAEAPAGPGVAAMEYEFDSSLQAMLSGLQDQYDDILATVEQAATDAGGALTDIANRVNDSGGPINAEIARSYATTQLPMVAARQQADVEWALGVLLDNFDSFDMAGGAPDGIVSIEDLEAWAQEPGELGDAARTLLGNLPLLGLLDTVNDENGTTRESVLGENGDGKISREDIKLFLDFNENLEVLDANFDAFDTAAHGGEPDGDISLNDLEEMASTTGPAAGAAQWLLDHPHLWNRLDRYAEYRLENDDTGTRDSLALLGIDQQVYSGDPADRANFLDRYSDVWLSDVDVPPHDARLWWDNLDLISRNDFLGHAPELIGGLDGLPIEVRSGANRDALQEIISSPDSSDEARERAEALLDTIETSNGNSESRPLHLVDFDLGGDGKVVVSVGNPDIASSTAVYVPGAATNIENIDRDISRMQNLQQRADELTLGESNDVATVVWLDYDPPNEVTSVDFLLRAPFDDRCNAGAPVLDQFIDGLQVTNPGSGQTSVIGHSYGSTVVGEAAHDPGGLAVDDIIVAGSPGMNVGGVEDLNIDSSHVWAGAADGDDVAGWQGAGSHGAAPHGDDFGANRFEVDTDGHSDYWKQRTTSLKNQARIVTGYYDDVSLEHGDRP